MRLKCAIEGVLCRGTDPCLIFIGGSVVCFRAEGPITNMPDQCQCIHKKEEFITIGMCFFTTVGVLLARLNHL